MKTGKGKVGQGGKLKKDQGRRWEKEREKKVGVGRPLKERESEGRVKERIMHFNKTQNLVLAPKHLITVFLLIFFCKRLGRWEWIAWQLFHGQVASTYEKLA